MAQATNSDLKLPIEYPRQQALAIYARRVIEFFTVVVLSFLALMTAALALKLMTQSHSPLILRPTFVVVLGCLTGLVIVLAARQAAPRQVHPVEVQRAFKAEQDRLLETYLSQMTALLHQETLRDLSDDTILHVARAQTLATLQQLDSGWKARALQFLHEAHLIDKDKTIVDLDGADLRRADLERANLRWANLRRADLEGADLEGAALRGADLRGGHLIGANLRWANLERADLEGADLRGASLRWADLDGAIMTAADLSKADLEGANLREADLEGADLEGADLRGANVQNARVTSKQLQRAGSLERTTLVDGSVNVAGL